ncbi:MAG: hypothetical protein R2848_03525 [Thermomicrobiales bacterium]
MLIYVSLRALAIDPPLRDDFGDSPARIDGSLAVRLSDLAAPNKSKLFERLTSMPDDEFQGLLGILREACRAAVDAVPPIDDAWHAARAAVVEKQSPPPPPPGSHSIPLVAAEATWYDVVSREPVEETTATFIAAVIDRDTETVVELWSSVRKHPRSSRMPFRPPI